MMASPRKKSSSVIFAPCMKLQSLIAFMYKSCSLCICVGSKGTISGGTRLVPSLYAHLTTGAIKYSFSGSGFQFEAPVMSSVVSLDDCKNPRKPCCSWFRTTSSCIDCFFWAPSYGTSDNDDLDLLFWYDFLIERS